MTKIYKRNFSEIVTFQFFVDSLIMIFSIWVICKYIIFSGILVDYAGWIALGLLSPGILGVWYSILGKYFYIILHDNSIVIQNYFLPFLKINRNYKEISKVRFWMPTPTLWGVESVDIYKNLSYKEYSVVQEKRKTLSEFLLRGIQVPRAGVENSNLLQCYEIR